MNYLFGKCYRAWEFDFYFFYFFNFENVYINCICLLVIHSNTYYKDICMFGTMLHNSGNNILRRNILGRNNNTTIFRCQFQSLLVYCCNCYTYSHGYSNQHTEYMWSMFADDQMDNKFINSSIVTWVVPLMWTMYE